MSTIRMMAQSISHPTTDLTVEVLQRSTRTLLSTTVVKIFEWITTIDIDVNIHPQILIAKDVEIRLTPNHASPNVHLYQMIVSANKIWRLSSTISTDIGIRTTDTFRPKKVVMTATTDFDFRIAGALIFPRGVMFASLSDDIQSRLTSLSTGDISIGATVEDDTIMGARGVTK